MWASYYVCVGVPGAVTTFKPTTAAAPVPTATGPQPQMPGITSKCKTYYQIKSGDSCWTIQQAKGVTLAQLRSWTTEINAGCTNLWLGYYICVAA